MIPRSEPDPVLSATVRRRLSEAVFRHSAVRFAVPIPTNSHEHARTASREAQRFRGLSPVFACLRGSVRNRGDRFGLAFLSRFGVLCGLFAVPIPSVCHPVRVYVSPGVDRASVDPAQLSPRCALCRAWPDPTTRRLRHHSPRSPPTKTRCRRREPRSRTGPTLPHGETHRCFRHAEAP